MVEDTAGQPVPLACSLDSEALSDRRRLWESIADLVEEREVIADGFRVSWRATERVKELLPSLVAAERDCCTFATWSLRQTPGSLVLDVTGPAVGVAALRSAFGV